VHQSLPLLLACGPSGSLDLYHLHSQPPEYSAKLTSVVFKYMPLTTCSFHPSTSDSRIFVGARRRYFYVWNVASGQLEKVSRVFGTEKDEQRSMERFKMSPDGKHLALLGSAKKGGGIVNILDAITLQWVAQARVDSLGGVADYEWWRNGSGLCIVGKNGTVMEWSLAEKRAVAKWVDEGGPGATVIALGGKTSRAQIGGDAWIAIGSSSGIVNMYSRQAWLEEADTKFADNEFVPPTPKPVRAFEQLTTPTSCLTFSPDGQILCIASRWKKGALRLIHVQTCTVYRNWPTANTPLGRISATTWGDIDGTTRLFVGNEAGRVMCWEIHAE
jgi:U3 small nucleolar RNA-associated protein 18